MNNYINMNYFLYDRVFEKIEAEINSFELKYYLRFNRQNPKILNQLIYNFSKMINPFY